jgi:hypothetical protein
LWALRRKLFKELDRTEKGVRHLIWRGPLLLRAPVWT